MRQVIFQVAAGRSRWPCSPTRSSPTPPRTCRSRTSPPASASSNSTAGFDISQTLIEYHSTHSYGRAFVVGPAEYAARRRRSASYSRPCSASRSARPPVGQLARRASRHRLRRDRAQRAAAAAAVHLVLRRAARFAAAAAERSRLPACAFTSTCAGSTCRRRAAETGFGLAGARRVGRRHRRRGRRCSRLGPTPPDARRAQQFPDAVASAGSDRAACRYWRSSLFGHAAGLRLPGARALQLRGRH